MICASYPPTEDGVGDYTGILLSKLVGSGTNIFLLTSKKSGILKSKEILPIIEKWDFWGGVKIMKALVEMRPDIIHLQYPSFGYKRYLMVNLLPFFTRLVLPKSKFVVTQHEFSSYSITGRLRMALHLIFSHKIIVSDARNKKEIAKFLPFVKKRLEYLPIASNISPTGVKNDFSYKDNFVISYFGLIRQGKGIEILLKAFSIIGDIKTSLLIIGGAKNGYHREICDEIRNLNLTKKVKITGYCSKERASRYLLSSDVCVLPFLDGVSERRGSFLAALSHRLPVITTRADSLPPGLRNGINVRLVRPGNPEGLASAIRELIKDRNMRERIATEGYKWSRQFSWEKILRGTLDIYQGLIK